MSRIVWGTLLIGMVACGERSDRPLSPSGFVGAEVGVTRTIPDLEFRDAKGEPFRLADAARGKVLLLFFGYMHCPDICPVHLANIAAVLDKMPSEVQREIAVVFVTVDPVRDTMPLLQSWVSGFHPEFIALTGSDSVIRAAQTASGLLVAQRDTAVANAGGSYLVGHAAAVIAFTKDGVGRVHYPFGTRQRDWAHDLPRLLAFEGTP